MFNYPSLSASFSFLLKSSHQNVINIKRKTRRNVIILPESRDEARVVPLHDDGDGESDNPLAVADRPLGQPGRPTPHAECEVGQRDAPLPRLVVVEHRVDGRGIQLRI